MPSLTHRSLQYSNLKVAISATNRRPVVVKADGLAAGKGVVVAANRAEAIAAIIDLENLVGSEAATKIVVEECLFGERSLAVDVCQRRGFCPDASGSRSQTHRRRRHRPNTGGMGTFTDNRFLPKSSYWTSPTR